MLHTCSIYPHMQHSASLGYCVGFLWYIGSQIHVPKDAVICTAWQHAWIIEMWPIQQAVWCLVYWVNFTSAGTAYTGQECQLGHILALSLDYNEWACLSAATTKGSVVWFYFVFNHGLYHGDNVDLRYGFVMLQDSASDIVYTARLRCAILHCWIGSGVIRFVLRRAIQICSENWIMSVIKFWTWRHLHMSNRFEAQIWPTVACQPLAACLNGKTTSYESKRSAQMQGLQVLNRLGLRFNRVYIIIYWE